MGNEEFGTEGEGLIIDEGRIVEEEEIFLDVDTSEMDAAQTVEAIRRESVKMILEPLLMEKLREVDDYLKTVFEKKPEEIDRFLEQATDTTRQTIAESLDCILQIVGLSGLDQSISQEITSRIELLLAHKIAPIIIVKYLKDIETVILKEGVRTLLQKNKKLKKALRKLAEKAAQYKLMVFADRWGTELPSRECFKRDIARLMMGAIEKKEPFSLIAVRVNNVPGQFSFETGFFEDKKTREDLLAFVDYLKSCLLREYVIAQNGPIIDSDGVNEGKPVVELNEDDIEALPEGTDATNVQRVERMEREAVINAQFDSEGGIITEDLIDEIKVDYAKKMKELDAFGGVKIYRYSSDVLLVATKQSLKSLSRRLPGIDKSILDKGFVFEHQMAVSGFGRENFDYDVGLRKTQETKAETLNRSFRILSRSLSRGLYSLKISCKRLAVDKYICLGKGEKIPDDYVNPDDPDNYNPDAERYLSENLWAGRCAYNSFDTYKSASILERNQKRELTNKK